MEIKANKEKCIRRNVFVPIDVAASFQAGFLDEDVSRTWILEAIHGRGPVLCPECRCEIEGKALQRFWEGKRVCCRQCGKFFTALTGSFLAGCHMTYSEVLLLAVFLHFGISPREIAGILRISPETVRLWDIKFRALGKMRKIS